MSITIDIADKVVELLNDATLSQSFTSTREYTPALDSVSTQSVVVQVIPRARSVAPFTRQDGPTENKYEIDVGVFWAADGDSAARSTRADLAMTLVEEISTFWIKKDFEIDGVNVMTVGALNEPIFDPEILRDKGIFASVVTLQMQEVR